MAAPRPSAGYQLTVGFFTLLLVALGIHSLNTFWHTTLSGPWMLLLAGVSAVYGWLWWRSRSAGLLVTAGAAIAAAIAVRRNPELLHWLAKTAAEGAALAAELAAGNLFASFSRELGAALIALISIGAGVVITGEALGRGRAFWTIGLGLLLFGTEWGWYFEPALGYFQAYLVLALMLWILGQAGLRDARWRAEGRHGERRPGWAPALAGVPAAALVATLLPSHFAPVNLGELGRRIQQAVPALRSFRGGGVGTFGNDFSLAATGFAPELGRLGGPVLPDNRVALRVAVSGPLTQPLYLRGAALLTYTGASWEPGEPPALVPGEDGLLPSQMGPDTRWSDLAVEVTPVLPFGRTIFHVLEPSRVDGAGSYTADVEANLLARRPIGPGATYTVSARLPLYSAEQIRASAAEAEPDLAHYLQLPTLPARVGALARRVAQEGEHPFDQALAVEAYVRQIPYTLTPPPTPPGRDFVDFFLFDLQQGYCTYHASAMVVMLRELGIPARFVEGFAIPASAPFTTDARGWRVYEVRNTQAHAWVEAYFPGYGWVTFDPTPRADLPVIARDAPPATSEPDEPAADEPVQTAEPASTSTPQARPEEPARADEPPAAGGAAPAAPVRRWLRYAAPLALPALLALAAARALRAQDRFRYRDARSVVQEAWEKVADLLDRFGLGRRPHETAEEYARTLAEALPPLGEAALRVAADYSAARYGPPGRHVAAADAKRARAFWRRAKDVLLERYGWRAFIWRRLGGRR